MKHKFEKDQTLYLSGLTIGPWTFVSRFILDLITIWHSVLVVDINHDDNSDKDSAAAAAADDDDDDNDAVTFVDAEAFDSGGGGGGGGGEDVWWWGCVVVVVVVRMRIKVRWERKRRQTYAIMHVV